MGNNRSFIVNFFILAVLIVSVSSCTCTFSYQMFNACAEDVNELVIDENMILVRGAKGDEVKWLQSALNELSDCDLIVDGDFGEKTESALKHFQSEHGLEESGIADKATISMINHMIYPEKYITASSTTPNSPDETVQPKYIRNIPEIDRLHPFLSYWKEYFITLKDIIFHFKSTMPPVLIASKNFSVLCIILIVLALIGMMPVLALIISIDSNGNEIGSRIGCVPFISNGCLGNAFLIILVALLLSPFISDIIYVKHNFDAGIVKAFFTSCLYGVLKFVISILGAISVWMLSTAVLYILIYVKNIIVDLPAEIIYTLSGRRREEKEMCEAYNDTSYKNFFQENFLSNDTLDILKLVSIFPALLTLLLFNIISVIMVSWIYFN